MSDLETDLSQSSEADIRLLARQAVGEQPREQRGPNKSTDTEPVHYRRGNNDVEIDVPDRDYVDAQAAPVPDAVADANNVKPWEIPYGSMMEPTVAPKNPTVPGQHDPNPHNYDSRNKWESEERRATQEKQEMIGDMLRQANEDSDRARCLRESHIVDQGAIEQAREERDEFEDKIRLTGQTAFLVPQNVKVDIGPLTDRPSKAPAQINVERRLALHGVDTLGIHVILDGYHFTVTPEQCEEFQKEFNLYATVGRTVQRSLKAAGAV